jgi:hypothetical protein
MNFTKNKIYFLLSGFVLAWLIAFYVFTKKKCTLQSIAHIGINVDDFVDGDSERTIVSPDFDKVQFVQLENSSMNGYPKRSYFADCNVSCQNDETCVAFDFNAQSSVCDLKSKLGIVTRNTDNAKETYIKKKKGINGNPAFMQKTNVKPTIGVDIAIQANTTPLKCMNMCLSAQNTNECVGFVYDDVHKKCSVKGSMGAFEASLDTDMYVRV